jgi:predicted acylesterase/phospholipase RssA
VTTNEDRSSNTRDIALTFAGGGNRAFYSLGLMNRWAESLLPRVAAISACSAGAAVITTLLSGRSRESREYWMGRARSVTKNFDWTKLLRGERPAPQGEIYRNTMMVTFADGGLERIRSQPFPIYIVASEFPWNLPRTFSMALGLGLYSLERSVRRPPHPMLPRTVLGFAPVAVDARACETAEELTNLILASSATPPFTPIGEFRGLKLLDGGMVDNAPAFVAERHAEVKRSVVILSRLYHPSVLGVQGKRLYLAPSVQPPIGRWDYTQPHMLDETVAMGEREADMHRPALDAYLR